MAKRQHQDNVVELNKKRPIKGLTENQTNLINAINDSSIEHIIVTGPAGTGKSYIPFGLAADWFAKNEKNRIVIARPMVSNGEEIGHLPGDEKEKSEPWAKRPLEIIGERIGKAKMECDLRKGRIEIAVLQMMQGASYDDCWLIIDEAEEMTVSQAKMVVTRTGANCKLILNGDISQCNLKEGSGLAYLLSKLKEDKPDSIYAIEFTMDDCIRSDICKYWIGRFAED